jgi:hypothetical protein
MPDRSSLGKFLDLFCFSSVNLTKFANFLEKIWQLFNIIKLRKKNPNTSVACAVIVMMHLLQPRFEIQFSLKKFFLLKFY